MPTSGAAMTGPSAGRAAGAAGAGALAGAGAAAAGTTAAEGAAALARFSSREKPSLDSFMLCRELRSKRSIKSKISWLVMVCPFRKSVLADG